MSSTVDRCVKQVAEACKTLILRLNGDTKPPIQELEHLLSSIEELLVENPIDDIQNDAFVLSQYLVSWSDIKDESLAIGDASTVKSLIVKLLQHLQGAHKSIRSSNHSESTPKDIPSKTKETTLWEIQDDSVMVFLRYRDVTRRIELLQSDVRELRKAFSRTFPSCNISDAATICTVKYEMDYNVWYEEPLDDSVCLERGIVYRLLDPEVVKENRDDGIKLEVSKNATKKMPKKIDLGHIKAAMEVVRQDMLNNRQTFLKLIEDSRRSLNDKIKSQGSSIPSQETECTKARSEMEHRQTTLVIPRIVDFTQQLDTMLDHAASLKHDLVNRSAIPPVSLLKHSLDEAKTLQEKFQTLSTDLDAAKSSWKKVWELELERIVTEQASMKKFLSDVETALENCQEVSSVLNQLEQVSALKASLPVTRISLSNLNTSDNHQGLGTVMQELSVVSDINDSSRRLDAMERNERMRKKESQWRRKEDDPFSHELSKFVAVCALKKTGGIENVERERRLKQQQMMRQTLTPQAGGGGGINAPTQ